MANEKYDVRATMASTALCFSRLARAVNGIIDDKAERYPWLLDTTTEKSQKFCHKPVASLRAAS
jgi:hypothetical protein